MDEYIRMFPGDIQQRLNQLSQVIREAAPEATEKISYQMPTFYLEGNLVHFAAYEHHIGFYPSPSGIEAFKEALAPYKWAKGSVQFPHDQPIPFDLIRHIVIFRAAENLATAEAKKLSRKKQSHGKE